ncbi:hypothetical protein TNIN_27571 [Trichonephila inaurata madagascariensis]|uniref:Uncharacterized protein n=1 Tax=Trichonephila inaurata madagascariensis TaxID=2747483 RepID=A0A8X7CJ91_9ARAC|nr:hypothetical protein TNIN_27571 [Trichonephila inaurata madagascariensis]
MSFNSMWSPPSPEKRTNTSDFREQALQTTLRLQMETFLAEGSIAVSGIVASRAPLRGEVVGKRTVFFSNAASCLLDGPRKSGECVEEGRFSDSQNRRPQFGEETGFKKGIRFETRLPCKRVSSAPPSARREERSPTKRSLGKKISIQ